MGSISTVAYVGVIFMVLLSGCSRGRGNHEPTDPAPDRQPAWLTPEEGAIVADSVRIAIRFDDPGVGSATLAVEESTVAVRTAPPWTFNYLPRFATSRSLRMKVAFETEKGTRDTNERRVFWVPNRPPEVLWSPEDHTGIYERSESESLRVRAIDPEDGPLRADRVTWWSDRQGLIGHGLAIPALALLVGRHEISVHALDRWARRAVERRAIELFESPDRSTPAGTVAAVRFAFASGRGELYLGCLDPEFRFRFCPSDRSEAPLLPATWSGADERAFFERLHRGPACRLREIEWAAGVPLDLRIGGSLWALIELEAIVLAVDRKDAPPLEVRGGRTRILLRPEPNGGRWRIAEWIDLGGGTASSQGLLRWWLREDPALRFSLGNMRDEERLLR